MVRTSGFHPDNRGSTPLGDDRRGALAFRAFFLTRRVCAVARINPEHAASFLSKTGPLARLSADYEERPSQIELAKACAAAFNDGKVAMLEAGTGVGKSLAYLIPAALWCLENKGRIVVSTPTKNLQQQLIEKDIPLVRKVIGKDFKAILVKGRQNYLCLRRLDVALQDGDFFSEDEEELSQIKEWAKTTADGSFSDLPFIPAVELWSRIRSETDACMGKDCPHYSSCFVTKLRKKAESASIIVVNHHLLFADIKARYSGAGYEGTAVLPPYDLIVFDEAHAIEKSATSFFADYASSRRMLRLLNHFLPDKRRTSFSLLDSLEERTFAKEAAQKARTCLPKIKRDIESLEEAALAVCESESSFRFSVTKALPLSANTVLRQAKILYKSLSSFCDFMDSVFEGIAEEDALSTWESRVALHKLKDATTFLESLLAWNNNPSFIFWIELKSFQHKGRKGENLKVFYPEFNRTPLSVAETMKDAVFDQFRSVVCVSATLRVANSFDFWIKRSGASLVEKERLISGVYPSPFPYSTNVLLALPQDIPLPAEQGFQAVIERLIPDLIAASSGSSLVLFTSYSSMNSCYKAARALLAKSGFRILCQDANNPNTAKLLQEFKADTSSVLFGVDTFWEGIDAPGDTLRHVIIVKFPFTPPDDPVFEARCERIEEGGESSFNELSVPEAVIKFRQGFGRLMRKKTDGGVVTVLDRRITAKNYGKKFRESIPAETQVKEGAAKDILRAIKAFLG